MVDINKTYELIRFNALEIKNDLLKALDIVRTFIIKKGLLLTGGLSIDYALRLKNTKLYSDETIPDLDVYSLNHAEDAYELGKILCDAGLSNIDVVSAIHVQSLRVRVSGEVVADITYLPPSIYNNLLYMEYGGVRFRHIYYTILDQLKAISTPYDNPPAEIINSRYKKDVIRLNLVTNVYAFPKAEHINETMEMYTTFTLPTDKSCVINGWSAIAYYCNKYNITSHMLTKLRWSDDSVIIPCNYLTIMTDYWEDFVNDSDTKVKYFNPVADFVRRLVINDLHIYDTFGLKIVAENIKNDIYVAHPTYIMTYFIYLYLYGDKHIIDDKHGSSDDDKHGSSDDSKNMALLAINIITEILQHVELSVNTYGVLSIPVHLRFNLQSFYDNIARYTDSNRDGDHKYKAIRPPNLAFRTCDTKIPKFKQSSSEYFRIDGSSTSPWDDKLSLKKKSLIIDYHNKKYTKDNSNYRILQLVELCK